MAHQRDHDQAVATGEEDERIVELRDGTRALIRHIRPDDADRLQRGLRMLSPHSRYLRFHAPIEAFTEAQLRYLTDVDGHDHVAWVALNPDAPDEPGMGVARYVRVEGEPEVAEAAITVLDHYQGKGLGTLLLTLLARSAIEHGVHVLRNYVLAENDAMLEIFDEIGATRRYEGHGVYQVDMALPDDPADLPDTPASRLLNASARGRIPFLRGPVPAWWPRGWPELRRENRRSSDGKKEEADD
jgi:GNAT superfamily N-acetyltransferase